MPIRRRADARLEGPKDQQLYDYVKPQVNKEYPTPSAYRSGILVQQYKKAFREKHGSPEAYYGKKSTKEGLGRWFAEDWRNQRGEVGYRFKSDVYRPTRRITEETPKTFQELDTKEIQKARKEKASTGRVKRF